MATHTHTLEMVKVWECGYTHTHTRDGEGLGMRLHTHTLEMVKVWEDSQEFVFLTSCLFIHVPSPVWVVLLAPCR